MMERIYETRRTWDVESQLPVNTANTIHVTWDRMEYVLGFLEPSRFEKDIKEVAQLDITKQYSYPKGNLEHFILKIRGDKEALQKTQDYVEKQFHQLFDKYEDEDFEADRFDVAIEATYWAKGRDIMKSLANYY